MDTEVCGGVGLDLGAELTEFGGGQPGAGLPHHRPIGQFNHADILSFKKLMPTLCAVQLSVNRGLLRDLRQHTLAPVATSALRGVNGVLQTLHFFCFDGFLEAFEEVEVWQHVAVSFGSVSGVFNVLASQPHDVCNEFMSVNHLSGWM
jgi:hypothetical protein